MSQTQHGTDGQSYRQTIEPSEPAIAYEETTAQSRDTADEVIDDWFAGIYPDNDRSSRPAGTIYSGDYEAIQRVDEFHTGEVRWNRETLLVRTVAGLIVQNANIQRRAGMFGNGPQIRFSVGRNVREHGLDQYRIDVPFVEAILARQVESPPGIVDLVAVEESGGVGQLLTFRDGTQVFVGQDSTAHFGNQQFGFAIEDAAPVPSPERAIDLLEPDAVRAVQPHIGPDEEVPRQGEWFAIPESTAIEAGLLEESDGGTVQKPGVGERPYGASPLDNHVPRDWTPVCGDDAFVERFCEHDDVQFVDDERPETPQAVADFLHFGKVHYETDLEIDDLAGLADGILVRGTLRHRNVEHYVLDCAEEWHLAVTHDRDVITPDRQRGGYGLD